MPDPHDPLKRRDLGPATVSETGLSEGAGTGDATRSAGGTDPAVASERWGTLQILAEIGHGAYGRVYRAWDEVLAREVALKLIRLDPADPAAAASVLREGQMLARVRHHNVVTVYGAQQIDADVGLWMEFVHGRSLRDMVRHDGALAAEEAAVIGISLCHAVAAVHGAGLLHRDIKAQNVMRESGGRIVLMDFGAGRERSIAQAGWAEMAGTPLYMPPEVLAGRPWSAAGDVYSLGALLYFLVTGSHPVEGRTVMEIALAHGRGQRRLLVDARPGLPDGFVKVVERALGPVEQRFRSAGEMARELADAIPGGLAANAPPGPIAIPQSAEPPSGTPRPSGTWSGSGTADAAMPLVRWALVGIGVLAGVWLLGFVTSMAFDQTLGREREFANETAADWLIYGLRSLIGPALYVALALLAWQMLRMVWRAAQRWIPPVKRAAHAWRGRLLALDRNTRAHWLLVVQIVILAIVLWRFRALLATMTGFTNTLTDDPLGPVRPDSGEPVRYRAALSVLVVASAIAWRRLLSAAGRDPQDAVEGATVGAGMALIGVMAILLTAPFRLVYLNAFPRADYGSARCYVTGQRGTDLLLFCPDAVPRTRVIDGADPQLLRLSDVESIFTRPGTSTAR